jgi:2-keto-4-pentenoate hydratase/2-oxohepta-3-ene-1,7-dioic acid hydratase in catechol pathway
MRFIKARTADGPRIGVLGADDTVALSATESRLEDHLDVLPELGAAILAAPATESRLDELELLAPVDPPSMRDFMVFEEHIKPAWAHQGRERGPDIWYEQPIGYFSNVASLRGPRDPVEVPGDSVRLDFELEVGAIVSRTVRSVTPDKAAAAIAGYLILCDWSARDTQFREMEGSLGPLKGKDFASSLGPIFVTPDEIAARRSGNGYDLLMTASVNGREYGRDHWSSAYWSLEELISYASWNSVVEAGALIGSGTCQGGCILELSLRHSQEQFPWLVGGDRVSLAIEGMGSIEATVTPAARGAWPGLKQIDRVPG